MLPNLKKSIVLLSALFIIACSPQKIDISALEELPKNLSDNLSPSFEAQGLKSFPNDFEKIKTNPELLKPMVEIDKSCTRTYKFPVVYFLTHCKPAFEINFPEGGQFLKMTDQSKPSDDRDTLMNTPKLAYYKLSTYQGRKITGPQVCQVYSVPWHVTIKEEIFCESSALRHYIFLFDYPGDPIIYDWYANSLGEITIPSSMIKTGPLNFVGEDCTCCGATYLCNGFCIPFNLTCGNQI